MVSFSAGGIQRLREGCQLGRQEWQLGSLGHPDQGEAEVPSGLLCGLH